MSTHSVNQLKDHPTISVIIPTYNRADTLELAIRSVLKQTVSVAEVLVCDDGSTDNSKAVVEAIHDPRVIWVTGPRAGRPAIPRNRGIMLAKGDWLAFLDSDDEWLPTKIERQLERLRGTRALACCTNAWRWIPGTTAETLLLPTLPSTLTTWALVRSNLVICSSALIHRSLLRRVEGFPESPELKALEDYGLWLRISTMSPFVCLESPELKYRDTPATSIRTEGLTDSRDQEWAVMTDFWRWLIRRHCRQIFGKPGLVYFIWWSGRHLQALRAKLRGQLSHRRKPL